MPSSLNSYNISVSANDEIFIPANIDNTIIKDIITDIGFLILLIKLPPLCNVNIILYIF